MKFTTDAVLGTSTGRLLGDIGGIYQVISFLIGRAAYTHDLAFYGKRASAALKLAIPDLPVEADAAHVTKENFLECLAAWERQFGKEIDLPESLRECLADGKGPVETLSQMVDPAKIVIVKHS